MASNYNEKSIELHKKLKGKLCISPKKDGVIRNTDDLSLLYTPGVAEPCRQIAKDKTLVYDLTIKHNTVAIVSDGTRVLGLGNIGPEAALPVMEGKALIMQQFAGIDAFPICLNTKTADEFVNAVKAIEPVFGAINLEDVETPKIFEIEKRLTDELSIPVFHDDQHGTAIVVLAGLINAMKINGITKAAKVGVVGAGAAGYAILRLLHAYGFQNITVFDSKGALHAKRANLEEYKKEIIRQSNPEGFTGKIHEFKNADIIISASSPGALPQETIKSMNKPNIVFTLANPISELSLEQAKELKIDIFGTGRSDYPNQINNSLCFPGFLRALLDLRIRKITDKMKIAAAEAIAASLPESQLSKERIVPSPFEPSLAGNIKSRIAKAI